MLHAVIRKVILLGMTWLFTSVHRIKMYWSETMIVYDITFDISFNNVGGVRWGQFRIVLTLVDSKPLEVQTSQISKKLPMNIKSKAINRLTY